MSVWLGAPSGKVVKRIPGLPEKFILNVANAKGGLCILLPATICNGTKTAP